MSFSVSAVSQNNAVFEGNPTPAAAAKPTVGDQIKLLAEQGHSDQQIATDVGLPVTIVASALGDTTTSSSSATSSASALVALSARLSVYG